MILASTQGSVETKEKTMNNIKPGDLCVVDSCGERVCFILDELTPTFVSGTRVNLLQYRDDQPEFPCPTPDSWAPYVKPKKVSALREQVKLCGARLLPDSQMREFARFDILLDELFSFEPPCEIAVSFEFALTLDDLLEALRKIRDESDKTRLRKWALGFYQILLPSVKKVVDSGGEIFILHSESSRSNKSQNLDLLPLFETSDLDDEDKDVEEKDDEDDDYDDEEVSFVSRDGDSPIFPTEKSVLYSVCQDLFKTLQNYAVLRGAYFFEDVALDLGKFRRAINELIKKVEICVENRDLPPVKRYYEEEVKRRFVETAQWELDCLTKEDIALFVRFVDELCAEGDRTAMEIKARACYEGNDVYKRDFDVARDLLLKLTQEDASEPDLFFMLGDIYHEGSWDYERFQYEFARDGVQKLTPLKITTYNDDEQRAYDKVFYYYSIAALGGDWNARLRLADMFRFGTYVPRNYEVYRSMIEVLYQEKFEKTFERDFQSKIGDYLERDFVEYESAERLGIDYAEIAIRFGEACLDEIVVFEESWLKALNCLLRAKLILALVNWSCCPNVIPAYEGRLYTDDLSQRIQRLIEETEKRAPADYFVKDFFKTETLSPFLEETTPKDSRFNARVKKLNDEKYLLKLTSEPRNNRLRPTFLLTIPQTRYCEFVDEIILTVKPTTLELNFTGDYASFSFDEYYGCGQFLLNGKEVARISGEFKWSEEATFEDVKRRFVSVKFKSGYKTYDYLCAFDDVKSGDKVVVQTSRGQEIVEVQNVFERLDSELSLPLAAYKSVVGKVDE